MSLPEGLGVVQERGDSQELLDVVHYGGRVVSQLLTIHNEKLERQQPLWSLTACAECRELPHLRTAPAFVPVSKGCQSLFVLEQHHGGCGPLVTTDRSYDRGHKYCKTVDHDRLCLINLPLATSHVTEH